MVNRGKAFEQKVKADWAKTLPKSFLLRIPDQMSGYAGTSKNICDFIGFAFKKLFLIECKSIHGNTFPITKWTQFDKLIQYKDLPDVYPGVLIWFNDHDKVIWVPIQEVVKMKEKNFKSINIKMLQDSNWIILDLPSIKKRVFLDTDYSGLIKFSERTDV